jgi:hypothetical protein
VLDWVIYGVREEVQQHRIVWCKAVGEPPDSGRRTELRHC